MTNKQYEHLGRAMMAAAELAKGVDNLREIRNSFEGELSLLLDKDTATKLANMIMTDYFPSYRIGGVISTIAQNVAEVQK